MSDWQATIGLEIHVQLATSSKLFSTASNQPGKPNHNAAYVDQGIPGTLPVLNGTAVRLAVRLGLALGASIAQRSEFARKNYFYPDLPKGYQISQYDHPILVGGELAVTIPGEEQLRIQLERAHLEEDAGKSIHDAYTDRSAIDLNRAGAPLVEIVTTPCMHCASHAGACMRTLHELVRYLGISTANMEHGELRCDANVSVARVEARELGVRTEIKNLNSFRFVERAINYEIARHTDILAAGGVVERETRLYDPEQNLTRQMRSKEEEADYRYFPDPDLPPLELDEAYIERERIMLPELPDARRQRYISNYELTVEEARTLIADRPLAEYFETATETADGATRALMHWLTGELTALLKRHGTELETCPISPHNLGELVAAINNGTVSGKAAKQVLVAMWESGEPARNIINREGLAQISDTAELEALIAQVIEQCPEQTAQYRAGKHKVYTFLMGRLMQISRGRVNPAHANELLKRKLSS